MKWGLHRPAGSVIWQPGPEVPAPVATLWAVTLPSLSRPARTRQATRSQRPLQTGPAPARGRRWNLSHTILCGAGLDSLAFSSQRGNLAQELADDFKIYLNKCGGQHRLLANCIIGLRPSCLGDCPTHSESRPGNPSCSAWPWSWRVYVARPQLSGSAGCSLPCSAIGSEVVPLTVSWRGGAAALPFLLKALNIH